MCAAPIVPVLRSQAGLLYGLVQGWHMQDCLDVAAASGVLRCERSHNEPMPTLMGLGEEERPNPEIAARLTHRCPGARAGLLV
jgi:hypothetical protein